MTEEEKKLYDFLRAYRRDLFELSEVLRYNKGKFFNDSLNARFCVISSAFAETLGGITRTMDFLEGKKI